MGLFGNLGRIFTKTDSEKKESAKKSGVRISDKPETGRQGTAAGRIFPNEPGKTGPEAGQNGGDISSDFGESGDIFDILSGKQPKSGPRTGPDLFFTLEITPKTADSGTDCDLEVTRTVPCPSCEGSGSGTRRSSTCPVCGGGRYERKEITSPQGTFAQLKTCPACGGRGVVPEDACKECHGTGHVYAEQVVTVHIPAGTTNYSRMCYEGLGDAGDYQGKSGDLVVSVRFC